MGIAEEVLRRASLLFDRSVRPPEKLLMTHDHYLRLRAEVERTFPGPVSDCPELTHVYGIEIEHFEDSASLYERAAVLVRDGVQVGIVM